MSENEQACPQCGASPLVKEAARWLAAFKDEASVRSIQKLAKEQLDLRFRVGEAKATNDKLVAALNGLIDAFDGKRSAGEAINSARAALTEATGGAK